MPQPEDHAIESHIFELASECHYLLHVPKKPVDLLFLTLHGYAMNAATMLDLSLLLAGRNRLVASIQAPHQFYTEQLGTSSKVGYNWGTRNHGTAAIRFHHAMVRRVRADLEARFGIPAQRTVLVGFSQPVGYNYRFAVTHPEEVGGVIGVCGGVPKDFETGNYGRATAALLHVARAEDEFFPESVTADYARKLRTRADDVEFHLLPGGHKFPSKGSAVVEPWIQRVFGESI